METSKALHTQWEVQPLMQHLQDTCQYKKNAEWLYVPQFQHMRGTIKLNLYGLADTFLVRRVLHHIVPEESNAPRRRTHKMPSISGEKGSLVTYHEGFFLSEERKTSCP